MNLASSRNVRKPVQVGFARRPGLSIVAALIGFGCGMALANRSQRRRFSFYGRSVVITGGARGLGLVMARQLAQQGARVALLARDPRELERAGEQLKRLGAEVLPVVCDVREQDQVNEGIAQIVSRFRGIDVLINNAGVIQVGPLEHLTTQDFEDALAIHLFAPLFCTLAVLPHMRQAGQGRIVNISSIGGKMAVPHLLPYSASKFALTGLSDGLRAELARENILVTTVCPGLMRTGSHRNAFFKGKNQQEYAWFAISASLPLLSVSAERAAGQILEACRRGSARLVIGMQAKAALLMNELFPGAMTTLLAMANRLLPGPAADARQETTRGSESQSRWIPSWLTRLSEQAALRNNEQ